MSTFNLKSLHTAVALDRQAVQASAVGRLYTTGLGRDGQALTANRRQHLGETGMFQQRLMADVFETLGGAGLP